MILWTVLYNMPIYYVIWYWLLFSLMLQICPSSVLSLKHGLWFLRCVVLEPFIPCDIYWSTMHVLWLLRCEHCFGAVYTMWYLLKYNIRVVTAVLDINFFLIPCHGCVYRATSYSDPGPFWVIHDMGCGWNEVTLLWCGGLMVSHSSILL